LRVSSVLDDDPFEFDVVHLGFVDAQYRDNELGLFALFPRFVAPLRFFQVFLVLQSCDESNSIKM
jgi:hypothetical protein